MKRQISNNINKYLLISILLLFGIFGLPKSSWAAAENIYVSQSGTGDGSSCGNPKSADWFNTLANWDTGTGKISTGDTVHLCGTISTPLTIQRSGTPGNPITILFEPGAKMSKAHWNQSGSNAGGQPIAGTNGDSAIFADEISYLTIDGGTNGIIEATANGTAMANQKICSGFRHYGSGTGIAVKNLTVRNLYVRTPGSADSNYFGNGIMFSGTLTDISIYSNTTTQEGSGIQVGYGANSSNVYIYNNTAAAHGVAINLGSTGDGATLNNAQVHDNDLSSNAEWSGHPSIHAELFHPWAVHAGSEMTNLKIYNNYFHGNLGVNVTGFTMLEGYITAPLIYNNLFVHDTFSGGNGDFILKGANGARVMNNTFINLGAQGNTAIGTSMWAGGETYSITNNIILNYGFGIYFEPGYGIPPTSSDNNLYYSSSGPTMMGNYAIETSQNWQALGYDVQSQFNVNPLLDSNYKLSNNSPAINTGASLASYFTTDKAGVSRPQGSGWDIGAYEYNSGGDATPPAAPHGLNVE